ncbi:MAG TPA: hypothetical protein VFR83_04520 [Burkholderiales bacterium]|nr:hypothetical protein [Burkholderiales bacterium]
MDASLVQRLVSLVPERSPRAQSGTLFSATQAAACRQPERMSYLTKFLHWLGPLDPMTREDQQILGVRSSGGRPMMAGEALGEEAAEDIDLDDELDDSPLLDEPLGRADAGTAIAQIPPPSTVGG